MWFTKQREKIGQQVVASDSKVEEMQMDNTAVSHDTDVRTKVPDIDSRIKQLRKEIEGYEERMKLLPGERNKFIIEGIDPDAREREFRSEILRREQEISSLRDQKSVLCQSEFDRLSAARQARWTSLFAEFIQPTATAFGLLVSQFAQLIGKILTRLSQEKAFDAECVDWNKFVDSVGAPANFKLPNPLAETMRSSLRERLKEFLNHMQGHMNQLRELVDMPVLKTRAEWQQPEPVNNKLREWKPDSVWPGVRHD